MTRDLSLSFISACKLTDKEALTRQKLSFRGGRLSARLNLAELTSVASHFSHNGRRQRSARCFNVQMGMGTHLFTSISLFSVVSSLLFPLSLHLWISAADRTAHRSTAILTQETFSFARTLNTLADPKSSSSITVSTSLSARSSAANTGAGDHFTPTSSYTPNLRAPSSVFCGALSSWAMSRPSSRLFRSGASQRSTRRYSRR
jgi:hypothetical protein